MVELTLGNGHTAVAERDPETDLVSIEFTALDKGEETVTLVGFPDGISLSEMFATVTLPGGVWASHGAEAPLWVECSDSPPLAALLASHYGCPDNTPTGGQ